jgi:hypothetical protein
VSVRPLALRTPALAGVFLCAALLLGGCATPPQLAALEATWPGDLPAVAQVADVPFFAQDDHLCGPAALAMVAQAAGSAVTPDELTPQVYLPGRQGALQVEMLAAARRQGLVPMILAPELADVLREVAAGEPVLILQNLGLSFAERWHYAVVIGYDRTRQEVVLHSGTTASMRMPLKTFEYTWARSGRWAVRTAAPGQIPLTAQADRWASAVAPLEGANPAAALTAWRAALERWPAHRLSMLGLGNAAYGLKQLDTAARAYEAASAAHPDFADAWNNLAQVRSELGQWAQAQAAIRQAVALGGPRLADYQALEQYIASHVP